MKKTIFIFLSLILALLISCDNITDLEIPESISIKNNRAYDIKVGTFIMNDYFSTDTILDAVKPDGESNNSGLSVYDYNPGNSKAMTYLFNYNLASIPLDFNEYLKNIDFDTKLSQGMSKKIKIPKLNDMDISSSLDFGNISKAIQDNFNLEASPITVSELGDGTYIKIDSANGKNTNKIPIKISSPSFTSAEFTEGKLELTLSPEDSNFGSGYKFEITDAFLQDEKGNTISSSGASDITSGGKITFDLAGKKLKSSIVLVLNGEYGGGTLGKTHKYKTSANAKKFKLKKIEGLSITENDLDAKNANSMTLEQNKKIKTSDIASFLVEATIEKGEISFNATLPDGWSGFSIKTEFSVSGGLKASNSELKDDSGDGKYAICKRLNLAGKKIKKGDIDINIKMGFSFKNATLTFDGNSNTASMGGKFSLESLKDVVVDINSLVGAGDLSYAFSEDIDSSTSSYLSAIWINNLFLKGSFTTNLENSNFIIKMKTSSNFFGIPQKTITAKLSDKSPQIFEKLMEQETKIDFASKSKMDFSISIALEGDDAQNPGQVKFSRLEFDREYDFNASFEIGFDMVKTELNATNAEITGKMETGINISEIFSDICNEKKEISSEIDKLLLPENSVKTYIFISKPSAQNHDPLSGISMKGKVLCKYKINKQEYAKPIIGTASSEDIFAFKNPVDFKSLSENGNVIKLTHDELKQKASAVNESFTSIINDRPENLEIEYAIKLGGGKITITKDDIDAFTKEKATSISLHAAIVIPFEFEIKKGTEIRLNITDIINDDDSKKDDFFDRDSAEDFEDEIKLADCIKSIDFSFDTTGLEGNTATPTVELYEKWPDNVKIQKSIALKNGKQTLSLMSDDAKNVMNHYPFKPDIIFSIGEGIFAIPRNMKTSVRIKIQTDGEYEAWNKND